MKKKIDKEKLVKESGKAIGEFKKFISRGNVVDMAVGVIIGSAFGKIVTSLVNNILMPLIGLIIGGIDFTNLSIKVRETTVAYGIFLQNIIDFFIIALCVFFILKFMEKFNKKNEEKTVVKENKKEENTLLLEEIRDLLKEKNKV